MDFRQKNLKGDCRLDVKCGIRKSQRKVLRGENILTVLYVLHQNWTLNIKADIFSTDVLRVEESNFIFINFFVEKSLKNAFIHLAVALQI